MSAAPAMPVFPDAYLSDTTHLSTEEHGAYLLLLMAMWRRNGSVPNDDADLARIVGLDRAKWRKTKKRLLPFLTIDGNEITQKRLLKEWEYVKEKRNKNAANGSKGGRPKANINNRLDKANGSASDNPNESPHNPEPIPNVKASAFTARDAREKQKGSGWVSPKTMVQAADSLMKDIDDGFGTTQGNHQITGEAVLLLPAVRAG